MSESLVNKVYQRGMLREQQRNGLGIDWWIWQDGSH